MPIYEIPSPSFQKPSDPWWVRISRMLWRSLVFLSTTVLLGLLASVVSTWLTTPSASLPADSLVEWLLVHWPVTISIAIAFLLLATFTWIVGRQPSQKITPTSISRQTRNQMLLYFSHSYQRMLDQSLQNTVFIDLGIAQKPDAVQNTSTLLFRQPDQMERPYPPGTSLMQVYDAANHELLILGEPGAGKSTMLLQLAQELAQRAADDETEPLPVTLFLSSWAQKRNPLQEWMSEQMTLLYNIPRQLSDLFIQEGKIIPLLDGLDELCTSISFIQR